MRSSLVVEGEVSYRMTLPLFSVSHSQVHYALSVVSQRNSNGGLKSLVQHLSKILEEVLYAKVYEVESGGA